MGNQSPTTRFIEMVPPLLVLAGAIALLQVHAIQFWTEFVGPMGWAWAVLLEVVALWLWYQRQLARRMLAMVASVLTLTGPIYMVCEPLVEEWLSASHVDAGRELQLERLALEASRLEESIDTFWANSEARAGWLEPIQVAQARLAEVDNQLATLVAAPPCRVLDLAPAGLDRDASGGAADLPAGRGARYHISIQTAPASNRRGCHPAPYLLL